MPLTDKQVFLRIKRKARCPACQWLEPTITFGIEDQRFQDLSGNECSVLLASAGKNLRKIARRSGMHRQRARRLSGDLRKREGCDLCTHTIGSKLIFLDSNRDSFPIHSDSLAPHE